MSIPVVDARGLACPEPVVLTQQAAAQYEEFQVLVDNRVAVQNITRFCSHRGLLMETENRGGEFCLSIRKK